MGLFDNINVKKDAAPATMPEVAACDRKIAELAAKKRDIIFQIGQKFVSQNQGNDMYNTFYAAEFSELARIAAETDSTEKRKLAVQGLRKCETCGNVLAIDSAFCNKCGSKLDSVVPDQQQAAPQGVVCPNCKNVCEPGTAFCASCGYKLV